MTGRERRLARAKKYKGSKLSAPKGLVYFGAEQKAEAKAALGLTDADLQDQGVPTWVYMLGGAMVIGGIVTAVIIAKK